MPENFLDKMDPGGTERVRDFIGSFVPELAQYITNEQFGKMYEREALDQKTRLLVTISGLTAMGGCEPQLKFHVKAAKNLSIDNEQIIEAIYQMKPYCGVPRVVNALISIAEELK